MASRGDDKLIGEGHVIVAAIDFGTTYSGFAYCKHSDYRNNPANPSIYCHTWNDGASHIREKAPTCVLFKPDGTFHSFGFEADQLTKNTYLEESVMIGNKARRKKMKAMDVFAAVIGHFRDLLLNKRANETDSTDECIQWVITVPAIWDLKARTFMRDAAEKAGIPNNRLKTCFRTRGCINPLRHEKCYDEEKQKDVEGKSKNNIPVEWQNKEVKHS
ncbi:unnamed protein product [Mytilus coruscus]|uniref:HSPA12A n=1 Tax=Mytilus coruscus TaxID=42192 RepID=A0A6J8DEQ2_MYTCO|nr:unnamed protein product [Mytilus coruscus]